MIWQVTKKSLIDSDPIAGISTPLGVSAIGVIRMSGYKLLSVCEKVLNRTNLEPRKAIFCKFFSDDNVVLDEILCIYFPSPNSYTGEEIVEFHFHGNEILLKEALSVLFRHGVRPAQPGEFSKRALLNGKLSLTKAEAIGQLLHSKSKFELELSRKNVFGETSKRISLLRSELLNIKAELEAEIDFSTEDLSFESLEERKERIVAVSELVEKIILASERTKSVLQRNKIVIIGPPNSGKSSLLNVILGENRSIVSDIPGTTRDFISSNLVLNDIPFEIIDTAGIRNSSDEIELEGIERSKREAKNADTILVLLDSSKEQSEILKDISFLESILSVFGNGSKKIICFNKFDISPSDFNESSLTSAFSFFEENETVDVLRVSCKSNLGISELIDSLSKISINHENFSEDYLHLEERQRYHFERISFYLKQALKIISENAPSEVIVLEINSCLDEIGMLTGHVTTEQILGRIFSRFCVGK